MRKILTFLTAALVIALVQGAHAQRIEVKDESSPLPKEESKAAGRQEATKYFDKRAPSSESASSAGAHDRYLALHLGGFVSGTSYVWGKSDVAEDVGKFNAGVTYRFGEWINSADFLMRFDVSSYEVDDVKPVKLSFVFAGAFPDANSRFPLYFGAGLGPGFFFKQARTESPLSLDYHIFGGVRFFDVLDSVGFFAEAGIKNHFHLLSDGQFNGTFLSLGTVFAF